MPIPSKCCNCNGSGKHAEPLNYPRGRRSGDPVTTEVQCWSCAGKGYIAPADRVRIDERDGRLPQPSCGCQSCRERLLARVECRNCDQVFVSTGGALVCDACSCLF